MIGQILAMLVVAATPGTERTKPAVRPLPRPAEIGARWGVVTSLLRSPAHNRAVGGAPNSHHLHGRAIDIARRHGVRHADIEAAYLRAGFRLIESLDEGDHSHFAFGLGVAPGDARAAQIATIVSAPADTCAADRAPQARRRPDRWDGCADAAETKPRLRPIEQSAP